MAKKLMLIDAAHPEQTRVAVLDGGRLADYDLEVTARRPLKGNIYLAKIVRIEPSLQAAFVEYGGTRHGFLPFNEIHPDYFQIPVADRKALLAAERHDFDAEEPAIDAEPEAIVTPAVSDAVAQEQKEGEEPTSEFQSQVESLGGDSVYETALFARRTQNHKTYKIQEVIQKRQILLVQVVKEERGAKGAAMTSYVSLAGRYCVLMPNALHGGGVSRKITDQTARRRLKSLIEGLNLPEGSALIVRTAGLDRTKTELKRDYDYLARLWDDIRSKTFESHAPSLVYEEAELVRKALRDWYTRDIDHILIDGEEAYKTARTIMKKLIPSHLKRVCQFEHTGRSLFQTYNVEGQIGEIENPRVPLKSGGYLVINPTEALVSIDVNSGRATRERNIESTAFKTNMEAAQEVARQLRLRDMAGLVVIDFIDMAEAKNRASVERCLKDALSTDKARIQVGKISVFGLLELSRQRLRPSVLETRSHSCPTCSGTGLVRSADAAGLHVLRHAEEYLAAQKAQDLVLILPPEAGLFLINQKRRHITELEDRFHVTITLQMDASLKPSHFVIRTVDGAIVLDHEKEKYLVHTAPTAIPAIKTTEDDADSSADDTDVEEEMSTQDEYSEDTPEGAPHKRRRRSRRRGRGKGRPHVEGELPQENTTETSEVEPRVAAESEETPEGTPTDKENPERRRSRRRRPRRREGQPRPEGQTPSPDMPQEAPAAEKSQEPAAPSPEPGSDAPTAPTRRKGKNWLKRLLDT